MSETASLAADLERAKALIDTPEKLDTVGSVREACHLACGDDRLGQLRSSETFRAILAQPGDPNAIPGTGGGSYVIVSFESILNRIDRAIALAKTGATP